MLPEVTDVSIDVYDVLGRHVTRLADSRFEAGSHSVAFNGSALGSGIYFYRMQAGSTVLTRKMMDPAMNLNRETSPNEYLPL
jgi:hypothetical protein